MVTHFSPNPTRDLGSLEEAVKTRHKVLAQQYNPTTALQGRTLLVTLPKEYRAGSSHPPSHLHTFNQLLPGEICITPKKDLPQDDDMPQPTIALGFPDRATKELARVSLAIERNRVSVRRHSHLPEYPSRYFGIFESLVGSVTIRHIVRQVAEYGPQYRMDSERVKICPELKTLVSLQVDLRVNSSTLSTACFDWSRFGSPASSSA
ncbi:MAG: hypothetical protein LQ346_002274 [Caloplaca aetnensis]|nr:MAG: hypothetical protein LQ346_002274 [Caloplaca aetnensis]